MSSRAQRILVLDGSSSLPRGCAHFADVARPVRVKQRTRFGPCGAGRSEATLVGSGGRGVGRVVAVVGPGFSSHGGSFEGDGVSVVYEPIEDGVPEGGLADDIVPVLERELAGDAGSVAAVAVFEDFEEVAALRIGQGREPEVVEDEEVDLAEALEEPGIGPVGASEREFVEEA